MTYEEIHNPIPVNNIGSVMLRGIVRMVEDDGDPLDISPSYPATGVRYYQTNIDPTRWGRLKNLHMIAHFVDLDEVEVRNLYLHLNTGGTPHTPEEIEKVREQLRALRAGQP